jgi:beta-1,4-mannosyl-glycoprotein beta-1,4-N-acetylglucosaminyltransferase
MKIYDCFTFFNELDVLEMRLNILDKDVDYFVLVESNKTHSGKDKELIFQKNKTRFADFSDKIIHIIVDDMPQSNNGNRWKLENFQREAIMRGLSKCTDEDIILISDLDEIPDPKALENIKLLLPKITGHNDFLYGIYTSVERIGTFLHISKILDRILCHIPIYSRKLISLKHKLYYYYLNGFINADWIGTKAVLYGDLVRNFDSSPQQIRESSAKNVVDNGGWHFSYLLTPEEIAKKIQSFAHSEFDKKEFTDTESIRKRIANGEDLFGRKEKITYKPIDESYPEYIRNNLQKYGRYIK